MAHLTTVRVWILLVLAALAVGGVRLGRPATTEAASVPTASAAVAGGPLAAQGLLKVQQGAVVFTPSYIDVYVAQARGFNAEQGLEVESTAFPDPGTASRAFVSGSLDFGNIGLDYMIRAGEQTGN